MAAVSLDSKVDGQEIMTKFVPQKDEGEIQEVAHTMSPQSCPNTSKTKRNSKADVQAFEREGGWRGERQEGEERGREVKKIQCKGEVQRNST